MKNIVVLLLAALLITGCTQSTTITDDTQTQSADPGTETAAETDAEDPNDSLFRITAEDHSEQTVTILCSDTHNYEFLAPEQNLDLINDAVYARNRAVEELLEIDLEVISRPGAYDGGEREAFWTLISGSIMAGDGAYDIVCSMVSCMQMYATPEYYMDINMLEDVTLSNPWWVTEMKESLNVQGKLLSVIGDMNLSMYQKFAVTYANLDILEKNGVSSDSLYSIVSDGSWTFEKLFSYSKGMEQDLNGDGSIDPMTDMVGLNIDSVPFWTVQASFDLPMITLDEQGMPYTVGLTDRFAYAADFLASNIHNNPAIAITDADNNYTSDELVRSFAEERSVFLIGSLNAVEQMRDMESDFTILPIPKLDDEQDVYRTLIATSTHMTYVPVTTMDPSLTGKTLESLAYYSYKMVVPAYYETALKERYSRDVNTKVMLELIREHAVLPFEYAYSTALDWPHTVLANAILNNTSGKLASTIESSVKLWNKRIEKLNETFE